MNTDPNRTIPEDASLRRCIEVFLTTPFRRLPVLRDGKLVGQVSRRDVLRRSKSLTGGGRMQKYIERLLRGTGASEKAKASVGEFMDSDARIINEDVDLLGIAQIFFDTPYRRLPVLRDDKLIGQVSRRDLLAATHELMAIATPPPEKALLYLSALVDSSADVPLS